MRMCSFRRIHRLCFCFLTEELQCISHGHFSRPWLLISLGRDLWKVSFCLLPQIIKLRIYKSLVFLFVPDCRLYQIWVVFSQQRLKMADEWLEHLRENLALCDFDLKSFRLTMRRGGMVIWSSPRLDTVSALYHIVKASLILPCWNTKFSGKREALPSVHKNKPSFTSVLISLSPAMMPSARSALVRVRGFRSYILFYLLYLCVTCITYTNVYRYQHINISTCTRFCTGMYVVPATHSSHSHTRILAFYTISYHDEYIEPFAKAGADLITIHVEPNYPITETLNEIEKLGAQKGITLNPDTPAETLEPFLDEVS